MEVVEFDRNSAIANGWQQCSIFNQETAPELYNQVSEAHRIEGAFYLVLSHACSLLNVNLNSEPDLEYIVCEPVNTIDGNAQLPLKSPLWSEPKKE